MNIMEKMVLRGREKENERSHVNNGAPRMKGFKKDQCNVGCSRGRFFRNSLRWPIYIINSVYKNQIIM